MYSRLPPTLPARVALLDTRGIAGGFYKFGTGLVGSAKQASQRRYLAAFAVAADGAATPMPSSTASAQPATSASSTRTPGISAQRPTAMS